MALRILTYRDHALHPSACEVTCGRCGHVFRVTRLRKGEVKCPVCKSHALLSGGHWLRVLID